MDFPLSECFPGLKNFPVSSPGVSIARCWVTMAAVRAVSGGCCDADVLCRRCVSVCECVCAVPESGVFEEAEDANILMFVYAGC